MTGVSREAPTSERVRAFSAILGVSEASSSDTAQALVTHIREEKLEESKEKEERERWRRWWQQSLCAEFET